MSDSVPPSPPPPPETPSTPAPPPPQPAYVQPVGVVPESIGGVFYNTGLTILLMFVTLGIWGFFWVWRTCEDLKHYNGDGLGGALGLVIQILLSPVLMFLIPNEIKNMYERDGRQSPVSPLWGLWFLLPIIGNIIWYVKVQSVLNEFWLSKGARPA
jgi:hypothetical protein